MTKRYLSVLLVLIMAFGVFASGCAGKDIDQSVTPAPETTVSDTPAGDTPTVDNPDTPIPPIHRIPPMSPPETIQLTHQAP